MKNTSTLNVLASKAGIIPPAPVKAPRKAKLEPAINVPLLAFNKNKRTKRGVFGAMALPVERIVIKKPEPVQAVAAEHTGLIGLRGLPIREKIRWPDGMTSKAVIWRALEVIRKANGGAIPDRKNCVNQLKALNLQCQLRGQGLLVNVNPNNIGIEVWAYMVWLVGEGLANKSILDAK